MGHGTFRVVVDELARKRDRYIVSDVIAHELKPRSLDKAVLFVDTDHAHLKVSDTSAYLRIWFQPLRVELLRGTDDVVLTTLFSELRLRIEAERKKETPAPSAADKGARSEDENENVTHAPAPSSKGDDDDSDIHVSAEADHVLDHDDDYAYENDEDEDGDEDGDDSSVQRTGGGRSATDCEGCFEETFQGHKDPKVRGPESVGADASFPFAEHIYGIPERTAQFSLQDTVDVEGNVLSEPYRMYNLDVFEFELDKPFGLYGSIPFVMARKGKDTVGMLWLNAAETYVDVRGSKEGEGKKTHWYSESGIIDIFLMHGPRAADVFQQYIRLTGAPAIPQRFALGYHQCRWNYRDEQDAKAVDAGFDERDIPYDVLWLDIEHTDGKRYFTWDYSRFPNPTELQKHVAARGRKMVTIIDPHIKRDDKYRLHRKAIEKNYYIRKPDGKPFDGWCWPGSSSYFDCTSPRVRKAWANLFNPTDYPHFTEHLYTWVDMNEPSVFNGPEVTMQKNLIHEGDVEHRHVHNIYGHYFMQATFEGLLQGHGGNDRPFVLSRSFFVGSQRYGAVWTGDNTASWDHLESSVRMLLPLQISGIIFSGADVGGFFGNPAPDLLTRWYQVSAFQPFFRGHAHLDTNRREPWLFGEPYTTHIAKAIRTRYEYIPLWYTLFASNALGLTAGFDENCGGPPMRPMWWEFPEDEHSNANQKQWMVGNSLLVAPVFEEGVSTHSIHVPVGEIWYDLFDPNGAGRRLSTTGDVQISCDLGRMVVLQRGGTIVPKQERRRRSTAAMAKDPYTLVVALDESRRASGELYLDDGKTYNHKKGSFALRRFTFEGNALSVETVKGAGENFVGNEALIERVVILGYGTTAPKSANAAGRELTTALAQGSGVLTIQRPQLGVAKGDWILQLTS